MELAAFPDWTVIEPLAPIEDVPVSKTIDPLTPAIPAFAVSTLIEPLDDSNDWPPRIISDPPVDPVEKPADIATPPPW
jgi:hypothetical protein